MIFIPLLFPLLHLPLLPLLSHPRWYQRLFRTQPKSSPPPKPKTRRRASCTNCKVDHCLECKQLWHDGECQKATKEIEEQDKVPAEECLPPVIGQFFQPIPTS